VFPVLHVHNMHALGLCRAGDGSKLHVGESLEGGASTSGMSDDSSVPQLGIFRILLYTNVATLT
jgi:hypothetical protein